jgi:Uma2 family endonuclease
MAATTSLLTIEDFERLPGEMAENRELVEGELVDVSGNTPLHNWLRDYLIALLFPFVAERQLGTVIGEQEYDFEGNAHGPDISFFSPAKKSLMNMMKRVQRFVPDLAVEIASESDTYEGLLRKKDRYLRAGTSEVWLISPESREVAIYTPGAGRILRGPDAITTDLLPGFSITVERLFQGL